MKNKLICEKDYRGQVSFCGIPEERLYELYKNGSITGKLIEDVVCIEFGYKKAKNTQDYFDVDDKGKRWEVRCLTKYGASLIPSNQIGKGRKYNEKEFFSKLNNINGYIIIDIRKFPNVFFYRFGGWEIYNLLGRKIKTKEFDKFLKENNEI
jgi:hypothetical protein